jgi:hypothetical protein
MIPEVVRLRREGIHIGANFDLFPITVTDYGADF